MKRRWRDWLLQGEHEYTKSGKRKRASYNLVAQWVSDSWKDVPHNLISRSFLECGLSHLSSHGLEELHSKLRAVVEEGITAPEEEEEEEDVHTGITDSENDSDEDGGEDEENNND